MSIEQSGLPPAGWYPDPTGKPVQRWWDAKAWTAHERAIEAPPVAPAPQALAPVHAPQHQLTVAAPQHELQVAAPQQLQVQAPAPQAHPAAPQPHAIAEQHRPFATAPQYPLPAAPAYAMQPVAPVAPAAAPAPVTPRPQAQPVASPAFALPEHEQPMFPAPVSAVSVQSPTTAAFEFSFSSPDNLGVNGRAQAFRSAAAEAEPIAPVVESAASVDPGSRRSERASASANADAPTSWNTSSVWVLVLMPLLRAVFLAGAIYSFTELDVGYVSAGAIAIAPYLITILVAMSDRKRLQVNGFDKPAHWAWSLAGEWLYLVLRAVATRREVSGGGIVVLLWLLMLVIAAGGAYYYVSLTGLPLLTLLVG